MEENFPVLSQNPLTLFKVKGHNVKLLSNGGGLAYVSENGGRGDTGEHKQIITQTEWDINRLLWV